MPRRVLLTLVRSVTPALLLLLGAVSASRADDTPTLAGQILDDQRPAPEREAIVRAHPELSDQLIAEMARGLPANEAEEYRRIPWIWRVAIAAGKRNDAAELRRILDVSLPTPTGRLDDWRAVVVGGGLINGITQAGAWPGERLEQVVDSDPALAARYHRALELAATMADNDAVRTGTRYDALRMLGVEPWDRRGAQLIRYLGKGVHPELQMGAVSALGDVRTPGANVAEALISVLDHTNKTNKQLALDALLRDETRIGVLLDAVAAGKLSRSDLGDPHTQRLLEHSNASVKARAREILAK